MSSHQPTDSEKAKEASGKDDLYPRQSFETVSTLPQYTERQEGDNTTAAASSSSSSSSSASASKPKSRLDAAFDQVKSKMGREPDTPERVAEKAAEKQRRKEEYERLQLGDKTKYGWGGTGMSWSG